MVSNIDIPYPSEITSQPATDFPTDTYLCPLPPSRPSTPSTAAPPSSAPSSPPSPTSASPMDIPLRPSPTLSPSPPPASDHRNVQGWVSDEKLHEICIALCGGEDGRVAMPDLPAILYQYEQTHNMSFVNSPSDKAVIEWAQKPEFADATLGLEEMKTIMRSIRGDMREIKTNKTESNDAPSSSDGTGDTTSDRSEQHRIIDTESDEGETRSIGHRHAESLPPVLSLSANGGRPSSPTVFHGRGPNGRTTSGSSRGRIRPPKPSGRRSASYDSADDVNAHFGGFASGPSSRNVSGSSFHFPTTPEDALRPYDRAQSPPDVDVEDIDAYHVSSLDPIDERGRLLQLAPAGVATRSPSDEESPDRKVIKMEKQLAQSTKQTQVLQKRLEEAELVVSDMELKLIASDEQIVALTNEKNELRGKDRQRLQEVEQARQNTERITEELEKTKQELEEKRAVLAEQIASNERLSDKLEEEKARIKDMELMADQEPTSPSSEPQLKEVIQKQSSHIAELENNSAHFDDAFGDENLRLRREIDELKAELETRTPRRPRDRLAVDSPIPSPGPATIRKESHQESLSFAEGFDGNSPVNTPNPKMAPKARRPIPTRMLMSPSIKIGDMDGMDGSPDDLFTAVLRRRAKLGEGSLRGDPSDDGYVDEEEEEETGTVVSDTDKAVEVPKGAVGGQPVPPEPRVRRPRSASMSAIDDSTLGIKNRSWVVVGIGAIALCMLVRTVWYGDTPNGWHPDDWNNWVTANSPHMAVHEGFVPYGYQQLNNIRPYFAPI